MLKMMEFPKGSTFRTKIYKIILAMLLTGLFSLFSTSTARAGGYDCSIDQSQIPTAECDALVALYNSTSGNSWTDKTGWLSGSTPCSWFGVTCSGGTNVTTLNANGNNLAGGIPAALGDLSNLQQLYLGENSLTGGIPAELGNLSNLTLLDLHINNLSGTIPTQLGDLSNLTRLYLYANSLTGSIPTELGDLTNLTNLKIENNAALTGWLPSSLTNLTSLSVFYFDSTSLCERPDTPFQDWLDAVDLAGSVISTDVVCNIIFADGFESNDFSAWFGLNTGNGDLNVCAAAAMEGSFGACVDVVSNKRKQAWDQSMTDASQYSAHFYFDPNGLSMGDNEKIRLMQLRTGSDTIRPAFVQVRYKDGGYEIRIRAQTDASVTLSGSWYPISDAPVAIDIDWMAATGAGNNDGYVTLWLDGVEKGTISGIDNDTLLVNEVKLGFTSRLGTKIISGTFYLDGFVSSDDGFIGP